MKAYTGTFIKKSGEVRTMTFAKVNELPKEPIIVLLPEGKGGQKVKKLPEGMELVWDIENNYYRMFNFKTVVGKLEEFEIDSTTLTQKQGV